MKRFDSNTFFDILLTLKSDQKANALLPELKIVLAKAVWEGRAKKELLEEFDKIVAY